MKKATKKLKKGTLHRMLRVPPHKRIPTARLRKAIRTAKFWLKGKGSGGGRTRAGWKKRPSASADGPELPQEAIIDSST